MWLISLGSNGETTLYLKPQKCVNTILRKSACRGLPALPTGARWHLWVGCVTACPERKPNGRQPAKKAPITDHRRPACVRHYGEARQNFSQLRNSYGLGAGVGRGLGVGVVRMGVGLGGIVPLAVGVGLAGIVAVAVAVGVALTVTVAVAVAVGVGVVAPQGVAVDGGVGETLGVGPGVPTAAAISTRPQP